MPVNESKTIGPYQIQEVLGYGGMSTVYKAFQPDLDRTVAIKVPVPALAHDPAFRNRFQREAQLIARLRHSHIVVIYGVGEDGNVPYLVMEYLEGPTLRLAIRQRRQAGAVFTPAEVLELLKPLANALDYAHDHHVIHRDLKPENIILTDQGPVITDFGLAKLMQAEGATISLVMGTPAYMAPEQIEGRPVDRRTDVYALGILLYELLAGQAPFSGSVPSAVAHAHLHQAAPAMSALNPHMRVSPLVEEVVQRAIAKRQEDRWPTAGAMLAALTQSISAPPEAATVRAGPAPLPARPAALPPARPAPLQRPSTTGGTPGRLVLLIPLIALALLIGGLWAARSLNQPASPDVSEGQRSAVVATEDAAATASATTEGGSVAVGASEATATAAPEGTSTASATEQPATPEPTITAPAGPTATPDPTVRGRVRAQTGAYLRSGPGTAYPTVAGLPDGAGVIALNRVNEWLEVAAETGERGWIAAALVQVAVGDVASLPARAVAPPPAPPTPTAPLPTPAPPPRVAARPTPVPPPPPSATPVPPPPPSATPAPPRLPEPTPVPPAPSGARVRLEDTNFQGGWRNRGASVYGGRTATWVYGQNSGYSRMSATFDVGGSVSGTATLVIEGMDSEEAAKTPLRIAVNDVVLFEGASPFPNDDLPFESGRWSAFQRQFDAAILRPGANTITITNLAPGNRGSIPFVAVDYAAVQLP